MNTPTPEKAQISGPDFIGTIVEQALGKQVRAGRSKIPLSDFTIAAQDLLPDNIRKSREEARGANQVADNQNVKVEKTEAEKAAAQAEKVAMRAAIDAAVTEARTKIEPLLPPGVQLEIKGPFLNFTVDNATLGSIAEQIAFSPQVAAQAITAGKRKKFMVEFPSPNTNKPLHLGHLRNIALGKSLVQTLRFLGYDILSANLTNDRGIHICKSMVAYALFNQGDTPESTGIKGDHFVGSYYVLFEKELQKQAAELEIDREQTPIMQQAREYMRRWEQDDPEIKALWEKMNEWTFEGFRETFDRLDVHPDREYLESVTYKLGKDIVEEGLEKGIFEKRPDGSVGVDLVKIGIKTEEKIAKEPSLLRNVARILIKLFIFLYSIIAKKFLKNAAEDDEEGKGRYYTVLRKDGTSVYMTQDLGNAVGRIDQEHLDGTFYVVAEEQQYHFRVLFKILETLGYEWAKNLVHFSYGMVNLPEGRMKSREGTVVDADDLLTELRDKVKEVVSTREGKDGEKQKISDESAELIGQAALFYYLLSYKPNTTIKFDPEKSIDFEGKTGPYIMYQYVRAGKILETAKPIEQNDREIYYPHENGITSMEDLPAGQPEAQPTQIDFNVLKTPEEHALLLQVLEFSETMRAVHGTDSETGKLKIDQTHIAEYAYNLAKAFSAFYGKCPILTAESDTVRSARIRLVQYVHTLLGTAFDLLAIRKVERM